MKFVRVRLPTKFAGAVIAIVLLFGTINILLINQQVKSAIEKELQKRLFYISTNLANSSINPILYEDWITLQKLVDDIPRTDPDIGYCFIVDRNQNVLVHSFADGFPIELLSLNRPLEDSRQPNTVLIDAGEDHYRDIAMPILDGTLGTVRVGVRESPIQQELQNVLITFFFMVVIFLILGISGAVLVARLITLPIDRIVTAAEHLDIESPPVRIKPMARDEIGYLTVKFNQMSWRLHRLYQQLKLSQQKLIQTEKMAALGVMASGIAHEINNPLTGLQNAVRRIMQAPGDRKQIERYRPLIENAMSHIARVTQNLLWFAHPREDADETITVGELIEKSLMLVTYSLEKNRIVLIREIAEPHLEIVGKPQHLQQVLINLILNAVDAMEDGGELMIRSYRRRSLILEVEDTGRGIPPDEQDRVFDPFFTTKPAGKGTGLGLSVSYQIIQAHGGKLTFSSSVGKGTVFRIQLPLNTKTNDNG